MYEHIRRIHFVGIGGIGMSGIAEVLINLGYRVSGSDLHRSPLTDRLRRRGAVIRIGHRAAHVGEAQVVVTSSAVAPSNPEVRESRRRGIPVIARAEMLAELMRLKYGIAVAGSHGKTSTTSLVATVLHQGNLDPTAVIGGRLKSFRSNARLGKGEFLVAEADESDGSFLHLSPTIAVVTNIDREHLDHYRDYADLQRTFELFLNKIPFYGLAVLCSDHPVVAELAGRLGKRVVTYGLKRQGADLTAEKIRIDRLGSRFQARYRKESLGPFRIALPGRHNVLNSLAAIAVGLELGIPVVKIRQALASFQGISRRFEVVCREPVTIIDDYGHHPEEIRSTLRAVRDHFPGKKRWVLFQPHRYTRTKLLWREFTRAFHDADHLVITEIYPAGEKPIPGINGARLAKKIPGARFIPSVGRIAPWLASRLTRPGEVVVTLGAGDIWKAGRELARRFGEK